MDWKLFQPLMRMLLLVVLLPFVSHSADRRERNYRMGDLRQENPYRQLQSPDPLSRLDAVVSLAKSEGRRFVPWLVGLASDPDDRVRLKAIDLLGAFKASEAVPVLLSNLILRTSDAEKHRTVVALGEIGDPRAIQPLALFLKRGDIAPETRAAAVVALGSIDDPESKEVLRVISKQDPDGQIRRLAYESLGEVQK